jgi:hypothetical protein
MVYVDRFFRFLKLFINYMCSYIGRLRHIYIYIGYRIIIYKFDDLLLLVVCLLLLFSYL